MDPLSQGILGASLPLATTKNKLQRFQILIIGFLSGMSPDLDILIRSSDDPILFLEFHLFK